MAAYERMMSSCGPNLNNVTVVFVDRAGQVVLQARANSAALHNLDLARRKAYTGRTFRTKSIEWRDRTTGTQPAAGQRMLAEVIPLGGGVADHDRRRGHRRRRRVGRAGRPARRSGLRGCRRGSGGRSRALIASIRA